MATFTQVFIAGTGDHWCRVSQWEKEDCSSWRLSFEECNILKKNLTTLYFHADDQKTTQCMKYNYSGIDLERAYSNVDDVSQLNIIKCDEGWFVDKSVFKSTITEDWELFCDRAFISNMLQSVYLTGSLFGSIIFGNLSDRIGRYYTFLICAVSGALLMIMSALSPNAVVFGIVRFLVAATLYGLLLTSYVIATEMVVPSMRVYVGVVLWYCWAAGFFVLSILGRYISSWRLFIVLTALPSLSLVPAIRYLDESPRWLISNTKQVQRTKKVLKRIARTNTATISTDYIHNLNIDTDGAATQDTRKASFLGIIRNPALLLYLLNLMYNWFVQSLVYYGLSLGTSSLGVNIFVAFCISGAVEVAAYTASIFTMKYLGRKLSTAPLMIVAGVACFATIYTPPGPIRVTVAMIGKFAITTTFSNVYLLTAEMIFPTPLRTTCIASCSLATCVGGMVAPMVLFLETIWEDLPLVCFASSSVLAGFLVFFLPETKGKPMPDTIEESLNLKYLLPKKSDEIDDVNTNA